VLVLGGQKHATQIDRHDSVPLVRIHVKDFPATPTPAQLTPMSSLPNRSIVVATPVATSASLQRRREWPRHRHCRGGGAIVQKSLVLVEHDTEAPSRNSSSAVA